MAWGVRNLISTHAHAHLLQIVLVELEERDLIDVVLCERVLEQAEADAREEGSYDVGHGLSPVEAMASAMLPAGARAGAEQGQAKSRLVSRQRRRTTSQATTLY